MTKSVEIAVRRDGTCQDLKLNFLFVVLFAPVIPWALIPTLLARVMEVRLKITLLAFGFKGFLVISKGFRTEQGRKGGVSKLFRTVRGRRSGENALKSTCSRWKVAEEAVLGTAPELPARRPPHP